MKTALALLLLLVLGAAALAEANPAPSSAADPALALSRVSSGAKRALGLSLPGGEYFFRIQLAAVAPSGLFPIALTTPAGSTNGALALQVSAAGKVSGQLLVGGGLYVVSGHYRAVPARATLSLSAVNGTNKLTLLGTLTNSTFLGRSNGRGGVAPGRGTFALDVSSAAPLTATASFNLSTNTHGALVGSSLVSAGGFQLRGAVKGGAGTNFALSLRGSSFSWVGKCATVPNGFTASWTAAGFGASARSNMLAASLVPALKDVVVSETLTQMVSAAQGAQLLLPGGTAVSIPPAALSNDYSVAVSLLSSAPQLPPNGVVRAVGPAVALSFSGASVSSSAGQSPRVAKPDISLNTGIQIVIPYGASVPAQVDGAAAMADIVDLSGGDTFIGIPGQYDPNLNAAVINLDPQLLQNAQVVNVSLVNVRPAIEAAPLPNPGARIWTGSRWLEGTPGFSPKRKTLVLVHGMASSVECAFSQLEDIRNQGCYQQILGFDYNWVQPIEQSGGQLAAFLNGLRAAGLTQVDIEAHSEGVPVSLSAAIKTSIRIRNMVLLGGPIMGTPAAYVGGAAQGGGPVFNAFLTCLFYIACNNSVSLASLAELSQTSLPADLQPGSAELAYVRGTLAAQTSAHPELSPTNVIVVGGYGPLLPPVLDGLIFGSDSNDGVIPLESAQALGWGLPSLNPAPPYPINHVQLQSSSDVITFVQSQLTSDTLAGTTWSGVWSGGTYCCTGGANGPTVTANGTWSLFVQGVDLINSNIVGTLTWAGIESVCTPNYDDQNNFIGFTRDPWPVAKTLNLDSSNNLLRSVDNCDQFFITINPDVNGQQGGTSDDFYGPFIDFVPLDMGTGELGANCNFLTHPYTDACTGLTIGKVTGARQ